MADRIEIGNGTPIVGEKVVTWMGKSVKDMTREELETAFMQLGKLHHDNLRAAQQAVSSLSSLCRFASPRR